mgnify:CR=1 FL=1|jgi:hypothetical protein
MPRVSDASMMTEFRRVRATVNADPVKKTAVFVAPLKQGYLSSTIRASEVRRYGPNTVLALPEWKSPRFNGRFFMK